MKATAQAKKVVDADPLRDRSFCGPKLRPPDCLPIMRIEENRNDVGEQDRDQAARRRLADVEVSSRLSLLDIRDTECWLARDAAD